MKQSIFEIRSNEALTDSVYKMVLQGDTSAITAPGQFVNILLEGKFLRRPISVCAVDGDILTLIYKVVGEGTDQMSTMTAGEKLDILCGLGNGFDTSKAGERPLLIGGGVGTPPMYQLCRELVALGAKPTAIIGFNTADEVFLKGELEAAGARVIVATADGSVGVKGFVTTAMEGLDYTFFYTCGPEPMLRAIDGVAVTSGELSFEERMGCGFGACMGCSCKTKYGNKRICTDGPVLTREEIIW